MEMTGVMTTEDCVRNDALTEDAVRDNPTVKKPCAKTFQAPIHIFEARREDFSKCSYEDTCSRIFRVHLSTVDTSTYQAKTPL